MANASDMKRDHSLAGWTLLIVVALAAMAALAWVGTEKFDMQTTASGLKFKVVRAADGPKPVVTDMVLVHYEGRLPDGTVFDSSYQRGEPAAFPLNGLIPGWTEGIQLMSKGSKFHFVIPPNLAYGEKGAGGVIPPNATLEFDVELLDIAPSK